MRSAQRSVGVLVLIAALFASFAALSRLRSAPPGPAGFEVRAAPVELPPGDPAARRLGSLSFRGGLVLTSDDPRFGGLSDLRVSPDGRRMVAVSDCGHGFSAELRYDAAGALSGVGAPRLVDLLGPGGRELRVGETDAESLVADGAHLEVGFEGRGRVWRYASEPAFGLPVEALDGLPPLSRCGPNLGLEAMTGVDDGGRRLLVCEGERTPALAVPAWLGTRGAWTERPYPLHHGGGWAGQPFRPTAATRLANGDLLVCERRFPPFGARVVRVPQASLRRAEGPLETVEVASLDGSALVDNYEGIDTANDASGRTLVFLLSDDNACAKPGGATVGLARTRLVVFELAG